MLNYYSEKFSFIHSINLLTVNEYIADVVGNHDSFTHCR